MSKFTKGPWENEGEDIVVPDVPCIVISAPYEDGRGKIEVCTVSSFLMDDENFQITNEVEFNAHLIAAAPELYEAIEKTLLALDGLIKIDTKNELKEARILMIEALAKARGGE